MEFDIYDSFGLQYIVPNFLCLFLATPAARKGLDEKADFDYFTIYEQGGAPPARQQETGLDTKADFDYYTIYDQCPKAPAKPGAVGKALSVISAAKDSKIPLFNSKRYIERGLVELELLMVEVTV